jgi:hypothetical protein
MSKWQIILVIVGDLEKQISIDKPGNLATRSGFIFCILRNCGVHYLVDDTTESRRLHRYEQYHQKEVSTKQ